MIKTLRAKSHKTNTIRVHKKYIILLLFVYLRLSVNLHFSRPTHKFEVVFYSLHMQIKYCLNDMQIIAFCDNNKIIKWMIVLEKVIFRI